MEQLKEMMGRIQLAPMVSVGFLNVIDATSRSHLLSMNMARSFEVGSGISSTALLFYWLNYQQFNQALKVLFHPVTLQDRVLQKYMNVGAYVLTIDDGREHFELADQEGWSSTIKCGTTIVMSVIMTEEVYDLTILKKYKCPFCDCWNRLSWTTWWVVSTVTCYGSPHDWIVSRFCQRRFQVKPADQDIHRGATSDETATSAVSKNEQDLIQNIYLTRSVSVIRC